MPEHLQVSNLNFVWDLSWCILIFCPFILLFCPFALLIRPCPLGTLHAAVDTEAGVKQEERGHSKVIPRGETQMRMGSFWIFLGSFLDLFLIFF
jgi:hypothetical protein